MMLSKEPEDSISAEPKAQEPASTEITETTDDREKELQRRLAMLGVEDEDEEITETKAQPEPIVDLLQPTEASRELLDLRPETESPILEAVAELSKEPEEKLLLSTLPSIATTPDPVVEEKPAVAKTNKSALLARIMAAQERAKQAQTKISSQQDSPAVPMSIAAEKEKMMHALNPHIAVEEVKVNLITMPPPPPFEILEQQQPAPMQVQPPPPSFDVVEDIFQQTPSAPPPPPMEQAPDLLFDGLTPMAPPPFESTMHQHVQETTGLMDGSDMVEPEGFDFDVDGNHLSSEEKRKMIEEQRAIMEQIQKQAGQNAASEAAVRADAFEQRSNIAAAAATGAETQSLDGRRVNIGGGKKVALHGQEKTHEAIKNGTAILVQCLNCMSWMQVTGSATLMFCPICNVVSQVVAQKTASTKEEAKQIDIDRIMAEELQRQMNEESEQAAQQGYPAARRGAARAENQPNEKSWWDSISSALGVAEEETEQRSAEINVNRPPGSITPSQRRLHHANIDGDESDLHLEREGLLGSSSGSPSRHSAQVAERQPLFSCVVDSISSTANAVGDSITSYAQSQEEEVHGVDTTSFLAVGNVGRDNPSGNYHAVPGND